MLQDVHFVAIPVSGSTRGELSDRRRIRRKIAGKNASICDKRNKAVDEREESSGRKGEMLVAVSLSIRTGKLSARVELDASNTVVDATDT